MQLTEEQNAEALKRLNRGNEMAVRPVETNEIEQRIDRAKQKIIEERKRVQEHPAPVEVFLMRRPVYPETTVAVYNQIGKHLFNLPDDKNGRRIFHGRTKIKVKAKIIDGIFTVVKWMDGI